MKYVTDAQSILYLIFGVVLIVVVVKVFLLDGRKKPGA